MALKTWSSQFPAGLDTLTQQPTLVNGDDISDVSQIHAVRDAVQALQVEVGSDLLEVGSIRKVLSNLTEVETGIVAFSGGGQGSAYGLSSFTSVVSTVAAPKDSVRLPASATLIGQRFTVINNGANDLEVFPASGESIDSFGADTGYLIHPGARQIFLVTASGSWSRLLRGEIFISLQATAEQFDVADFSVQTGTWTSFSVASVIPESCYRYSKQVSVRLDATTATNRVFSIAKDSSDRSSRVSLKIEASLGQDFEDGLAYFASDGTGEYNITGAITTANLTIKGYYIEG